MSELKTLSTIDTSPFKRLVLNLGVAPTAFTDGMTYYELLAWLVKFLEDEVVPKTNESIEGLKELQTYVSTYFDNLDVQEEINNKLDQMAESGQLTDIIAQYLQLAGVLAFDTVAGMQAAENLVNGSIAKTLGKNTYLDGKGEFYKIRTIKNTDDVDGDNIIALNDDTLVAEKIPNASIKSLHDDIDRKINGYKLNLMRDCIYDLPTNEYTQGSAVIGNKLYIMQPTSSNLGNVICLNLETKAHVSTTPNIQMYHAGDVGAVGDKIYISPWDATAGRILTVFDTTNNTTSTVAPFTDVSEKQSIGGVATYDGTKLICALENVGTPYARLNEKEYFMYDTVTGDVTPYTFYNPKNLPVNSALTSQGTTCVGNHYYVSTSMDNNLFDFIIDEENHRLELVAIYNLPYYDNSGLLIGEYEGLSAAPYFGDGAMMITTHVIDNQINNTRTVKCYVINPSHGTPNFEFDANYDVTEETGSHALIVNAASTSLYEDGTSTYPYKSLKRAIAATQNKNIRHTSAGITLISTSQQTYNVGDIIDCNDVRITAGDDYEHKIYIRRIVGSSVIIDTKYDHQSHPLEVHFTSYANATNYGQIVNTNITLEKIKLYVDGSNLTCMASHCLFSNISSVTCSANTFINASKGNVFFDGCPIPTFLGGSSTPICHYLTQASRLFSGNSGYVGEVGDLNSTKKIRISTGSCIVVLPGIHSAD